MSGLNPPQQRAVDTIDGPLLVIAGAGAGKTRVITHRILNLIKKGVAPYHILAITFTNKAAKEMRERVAHLLSEDPSLNRPISSNERPFVSTFHALGVHIIRENASLLGLTRHFTIYDRSDSRRAIKQAMESCSVDPKRFDPSTILNMISRAKGDGMDRLHYADAAKGYMEETVALIWEKYAAILSQEKALDFDDLLLKTVHLLGKHESVRTHYQSIWTHIHVDEYQDTNKVQYQLVQLLAEKHKNLCVVGDADQNIYSWRGATIENILHFERDYPEATVVALEQNYRSTKTILAAANDVIKKNKLRKDKTLYTDNHDGEKISLNMAYTEVDEARIVADTARALIGEGIEARAIAVLYRANFQSRALEEAFIKKNIPYQLIGVRFFERKEIKDVLSYIRAALNKESWGDIGRIINVPTRGIGKATIAKIMSGRPELLPPAMQAKVASFWKLLDDIRAEISDKKPSEAVKFVIQETGIERMYMNGDGEDEERLMNIRELVSVAAQYDEYQSTETDVEAARLAGIEKFLENAALASDQDDLEKDENAVKLMTVHASKGLEFDHVFITGMEQDLFPFKHLEDADIDSAEEEEERRLFYVALTRAKRQVHLSHTIIRTIFGAQRVNTPSEFISDIDSALIDDHAPPEKPTGAKALFIDF